MIRKWGIAVKRVFAAVLILLLLTVHNHADAVVYPPYPTEPESELWRIYDPELHYWFQQLTEAEKRLFSARYDCIALGQADLWNYPCGRISMESRERIDYVLLMDCPELLYCPQANTMDSLRYGRIPAPDAEFCAQHAASLPDMLVQCMEALDEIQRQPEWGDTDFEKEIAADRYLVRSCMYEPEIDVRDTKAMLKLDGSLRTAYGALVLGRAICGGYASAMTLAMRCFGVPCISTTGVHYPGDGSVYGHEWNIIQIGGEWVHEDVTFNDTDNASVMEDFFPSTNLTSIEVFQLVKNDPDRAEMKFRTPTSTSHSANYYVRKGQTLGEDWQDEIFRRVRDAHDEGKHAIGFRVLDSAVFEETFRIINSDDFHLFDGLPFPVAVGWVRHACVLYVHWE